MDLTALLFGYSKALYSNWIFYKPDHVLIDCGEGAASTLGNGSYAIERVLLTHGHLDHISGLPSLIWSRAAGMGDSEKPLEIYYPRGDLYIADLRQYLERTSRRLPYALRWNELDAGDEIALSDKRRVVSFATQHTAGQLTLGYKIVEERRRLKTEYSHLGQDELRALAQTAGREAIAARQETYDATLIAFGGDGLPLQVPVVRESEILVHEATLLTADDRKGERHSTLDEAVQVAARAEANLLLLHHVSGRYEKKQVEQAARRAAARHGFHRPLWCLFHNRLWPIAEGTDEEKC